MNGKANFKLTAPEKKAISLWCLDLAAIPLDMATDVLSPDEREIADRFYRPADAHRFSKTRGLLRCLLAERLGDRPQAIVLQQGKDGKPGLPDDEVFFNVSHSANYALVAIAEVSVGVDIQHVSSDLDWRAIGERFFAPSEREALAALTEAERREAFFRLWTLKEAYLKGIGAGLSRDPQSFSVPLGGGPVIDRMSPLGGGWRVWSLEVPDNYKASLAAPDVDVAIAQEAPTGWSQ